MQKLKSLFIVTPAGHGEKIISGLGGFLGILAVLWLSSHFLGLSGAALIVASMGASAVLLFAVPHGPLSQPWPLVGSHLVSAFVGVTCARFIHGQLLAASLSVGLAIALMYYLRCIHPPGGATALTAVLGGASVQQLGYQYLLTPVLLNVLVLLAMAIGVNWLFPWRRYPASWVHKPEHTPVDPVISHEHLDYALKQMGSFIDITEDDLAEIYELARQHASGTHLQPGELKLGHYYSNGLSDGQWSVRRIVDESADQTTVIFRVVAGQNRRSSDTCPRAAFALWAKHEVRWVNGQWQPAVASGTAPRPAA